MPADPAAGHGVPAGVLRGRGRGQRRDPQHRTEQAEVPPGHFDDVLLTKDTITIEPDVLEYKLYARDVGLVLALGVSGGGGPRGAGLDEHVSDAAAPRPARRRSARRTSDRVAVAPVTTLTP